MSVRVQVLLDPAEREAFRSRASAEGRSLSQWLREAGQARLRSAAAPALRTAADLDAFFAGCDADLAGREPDWEQHLAAIAASRGLGLPPV